MSAAAEEDNTFVQKCGVKEQASELARFKLLHPESNTTNVVMTSLLVECWTRFNLQSRSQKGESHTFLNGESQQGCAVGQKSRASGVADY